MSFSYQLYSSRNFGPLHDTLNMLKDRGYAAVEGYGGLFESSAAISDLKAGLDETGLRLRSTHIGLSELEADPNALTEMGKMLGVESFYVPYIMPEDRPSSADGWRALGDRIEAAGQPLKDAGFGFGYHNHDFEFVPSDDVIPMDALLEGGPSLEWEIDVAWVVRGDADPFAWIEKYKDRITAVHVKDIAPSGENADEDGWSDVGHGTMDWARLTKALAATPAKHFVMEHDNPSDDARFASRALASAQSY